MAFIRVLNDPACPGIVNMARDEALLTLVGQGSSPPTIRLYEWSVPTISLGYFQRYADYESFPPPAGELPVVRRLTGGGAIVHDRELTYSLTVSTQHALTAGNPNGLYELVHDALIECLNQSGLEAHRNGSTDGSGPTKGPFLCFARRHQLDVLIGVEKVAGSAQRRKRDAILQHGSIIVERRFEQQPAAALMSAGIDVAALRSGLPAALAKSARMDLKDGEWGEDELAFARQLESKYTGAEWTKRV